MHPVIAEFSIFGMVRPLTSYGLCAIFGILAALWVIRCLAPRRNLPPMTCVLGGLLGISVGILGAKLAYIAVSIPKIAGEGIGVLLGSGGLVFYGGLAAGVLGTVFFIRSQAIDFGAFADVAAPALALGHGAGRVGCFLFGCCYGRPTEMPWGVVYPPSPFFEGPTGIPLHPVQLYEAALEFVLFAVLSLFLCSRRGEKATRGAVFSVWCGCYGVFRLVMEFFFRGDDRGVGTEIFPPSAW